MRPMKLTNIIHDYLSCAPKTLTNKNTIQYELTRERFILIIVSATIYIFFLSRPLIHNQTRARLHAACQRMFRQSTGASKYFVRVNPTREDWRSSSSSFRPKCKGWHSTGQCNSRSVKITKHALTSSERGTLGKIYYNGRSCGEIRALVRSAMQHYTWRSGLGVGLRFARKTPILGVMRCSELTDTIRTRPRIHCP